MNPARIVDEIHDEIAREAAASRASAPAVPSLRYELPDGRIVSLPYDLCRARGYVDYQLLGGGTALAFLVSDQDEIQTAYSAWSRQ